MSDFTGAVMIKDVGSVKIRTIRPSLALIIFGAILAIGSIVGAKDVGRYWIPLFLLGVGLIALFFLLGQRRKATYFFAKDMED
jgi:hypothetical protein